MSDPKFYCRAEDLAIGYGKTPLMEHIGLGVGKGSILTLIGPNGAGKSTLLKTLAAQLAPQGGAVLLDGKYLADYSGPERARKMALMVPHTRRTELMDSSVGANRLRAMRSQSRQNAAPPRQQPGRT